jgi:glutamine synthetase
MSRARSSATIAGVEEAKAFFAANPEIDSIEMIYTDFGGVPRGKRLRQHEVIAVYESGRMWSIFAGRIRSKPGWCGRMATPTAR